jgi:hypothetical protein
VQTSLAALAVLAVTAAATTAAGGLLLVVLERVGTPAGLLGALAAGAVLILACVAGLASGTVRLHRFVTGGRELPGAAASLALAVSWPLACPGVPAAAAVLGFAVSALTIAPLIRASGAATLPAFLGRGAGRPGRLVAALVVAAIAVALGASAAARAATTLATAFGVTRPAAAVVVGIVLAVVLLPGGLRGATRTAMVLAIPALGALALLWGAGGAPTWPRAPDPVAWSEQVMLGLTGFGATLVLPSAMGVAVALRRPADAGSAWLWAALLVAVAALAPQPAAGAFPALAVWLLGLVAALAAAALLLHAGAVALAVDIAAAPDGRRLAESGRFATLRATTLVLVAGAAVWAAMPGLPDPALLAVALATATLVPAVGLALRRPVSGRVLVAAVAGGAITAAVVLDGRLGATPHGIGAAGLLGAFGGLLLGLAAALLPGAGPRGLPRPFADDAI